QRAQWRGVAGARNLCLECVGDAGEACSDLPEARCTPTSPFPICPKSAPNGLFNGLIWPNDG
ncbi:hypothetical protein NKH85_06380, partial [Mesorhizobium sp. M0924]|uniref:hypothetical protein n=1 Tax=unclassified Mesorhizobium TaxID=325217 RepID=UPI003339B548